MIDDSGLRALAGARLAMHAELYGVAIGFCQPLAKVIGDLGLGGLQIDDLIAIDNANAGAALPFERNDFHEFVLCEPFGGRRL